MKICSFRSLTIYRHVTYPDSCFPQRKVVCLFEIVRYFRERFYFSIFSLPESRAVSVTRLVEGPRAGTEPRPLSTVEMRRRRRTEGTTRAAGPTGLQSSLHFVVFFDDCLLT